MVCKIYANKKLLKNVGIKTKNKENFCRLKMQGVIYNSILKLSMTEKHVHSILHKCKQINGSESICQCRR